jgi:hypothetical protein
MITLWDNGTHEENRIGREYSEMPSSSSSSSAAAASLQGLAFLNCLNWPFYLLFSLIHILLSFSLYNGNIFQ